MNKKGQALEYLITYGWATIVLAIVVGVLVFIVAPSNQTERWQEEWQCTQMKETGRTTILVDNRDKIPENAEKIECLKNWKNCFDVGDLNVEQRKENRCLDGYTEYCCLGERGGCSQWSYNQAEKICVEKKPRQCLITRKTCAQHEQQSTTPFPKECMFPNQIEWQIGRTKIVETRECDQEAEK
jgi:hypothetical protein